MTLQIFDNSDSSYLRWMEINPSYFIVNTRRSRKSDYFFLHKSKCPHIATTTSLDKGAYTERNYIKIGCDDLDELKNWFEKNYPNFKGEFFECKTCNPFTERFIDNPVFLFPDVIENDARLLFEGAKKKIIVNSYERNANARQNCLNHYGCLCSVCNIDFEKIYGIIGKILFMCII